MLSHVLDDLPDRDDDYEAAVAMPDHCRTRGAAARTGEYIVGTGIPLEDCH